MAQQQLRFPPGAPRARHALPSHASRVSRCRVANISSSSGPAGRAAAPDNLIGSHPNESTNVIPRASSATRLRRLLRLPTSKDPTSWWRRLTVSLQAVAVVGFSLGALTPPVAADLGAEPFTLANGMRVVAVPMERPGVVHHAVYYAFGAADDPSGQSGIAHFIEHLMFNGTGTTTDGQYKQIIGRNGGSTNAYTSADVTAYYATIARDRLETVMRLEADRMTGVVFKPENFEAERQVIIEERLQRTDNSPSGVFREQLMAAAWQAHPYGRPLIGWRHEIEALTMAQVEAYYRRHYGPANALLVVAGDIDAESLRPLAERTFGMVPAGGEPVPPRPMEPPHRARVTVEMEDPRVARPRWSRQYRARSYYSGTPRESATLDVLAAVLGGASGRLHRALVVRHKVALAAGAYFDGGSRDGGFFLVYAMPADGTDVSEVEEAVIAELRRVAEEGVEEREVQRAAYRFAAGEIYARDDVSTVAEFVGSTLIKGGTLQDIDGYIEMVRSISAADLAGAAGALLAEPATVTGILRPGDAE